MDFRAAAAASEQNGCLNFFDGATAAEISSALQMPRLGAGAAQRGAAKAKKNGKGKGRVAEAPGIQQAAAAVVPAGAKTAAIADGQVLQQRPQHHAGSDRNSSSLLAMAQKSTRTAKNGREQQRAQKISDVIDQLKVDADFLTYLTTIYQMP